MLQMMLIHPHADWRNRWTQVLNDMPGCELVAAVSNFREANPRLGAGDYDVVWIAQSENDEMEAAAAHFPVRVVITEGNLPENLKRFHPPAYLLILPRVPSLPKFFSYCKPFGHTCINTLQLIGFPTILSL